MRTRMSEAMSKAVSISMTKSMLKSTRGQFSPFLPVSKEADIFETSQFKIFEMLAKSKFGLSTNSYQPQISAIVKEELRKSTEYFAVGEYRYCTSDMNENETVICRENDRHPGPREELLRIGQLATGLHAPFLTTIGINPSRSGRYMGCLFETSIGSTTQMFVVTDIANKVNYEISIRDSTKKQHINKIHSFEWGRELVDCSGNVVGVEAFFVMQNSGRPNRVYKCSFNTPTVDQPLKHTDTTGPGDTYNPILKRVEIAAADMTLIYSERDPAFFIDIRLSRDGCALICTSQAKLCSEVHVLPLSPDVSDSTPVLKKVVSRQSNMKCFIDCTGDFVFAVTNGPLLQEEKQQQRQPSSDRSLSMYCIDKSWLHAATTIQTVADWKRVWPMSTDSTFALEDYEIFQSAVVLFGSDKGKSQIVVCSRDQLSGVWKVISQPSPASDPIVKSAIQKALFTNSDLSEMPSLLQFKPVSAQTYNSKFARFDVECPLLRPGEDIGGCIDLQTGQYFIKEKPTSSTSADETTTASEGGLLSEIVNLTASLIAPSAPSDANEVHCSTLFVPSHDGCLVPLSIMQPAAHMQKDSPQPRPLLLLGYGAYGVSYGLHYRSDIAYLLQQGWTVAIAHVRGGGEYGAKWHAAGRGMNKKNSFIDFAACSQFLIDKGYTSPSQLIARVESAGGLIGGYMIQKYPHLFAGVIMRNPFLDLLTTMQNPDLSLTPHEVDEWGDVLRDPVRQYMESYCPCTLAGEALQTNGARLPDVFISVGLEDTKVGAWETLKFAFLYRSQAKSVDGTKVTSSTRYQYNRKNAESLPLVLVRLLDEVGHSGPSDEEGISRGMAEEVLFMNYVVRMRKIYKSVISSA